MEYQIIRTTDNHFLGNTVEVDVEELLSTKQICVGDRKFYFEKLFFRDDLLILKNCNFTMHLKNKEGSI